MQNRERENEAKFCFFCQVNNTQLCQFPIGQISRTLHTTCRLVRRWILSEQIFENFFVSSRFSKKTQEVGTFSTLATSGRRKSTMITDRRKLAPKWTLYWMSSFYFYCWNQFKVIPLASTVRTGTYPNISNVISRHARFDASCYNDKQWRWSWPDDVISRRDI